MKNFKIAKMNINDMIKACIIFYCIVIASSILSVVLENSNITINIMTKGLEISTVIFLFVCGLNSFKENFYFSQSNNISRKAFITGIISSIFLISIAMAVIDVIINRVINIFTKMPSVYDMLYGNYRGIDILKTSTNWTQDNSIIVIISSILICFALYCISYILGLAISMLYFRCNTIMKILISVIGVLLLNVFSFVFDIPDSKMVSGNIYLGLLCAISTFIILSGIAFLLIRRAEVKGK